MSGLEVAGIALAIFPILASALVRSVDGIQTIKNWRRISIKLEDYADTIQTQNIYYLNTLEELLSDIVQSHEDIEVLIREPRGDLWKSPQYKERLKLRLDRSYNGYFVVLNKMIDALNDLCKKLGVDTSGNVLSNDQRWAWFENIKHTLSRKIYEQLLKDIAKANDDLYHITRQSILLEPYRQKRRSKQLTTGLKTVREHATSIYQTFIRGKGWNCHCTTHHIARLRLETRFVSLEKENVKVTPSAPFTILLAQRIKELPQPIAQYQAVEISSSFDKKTDEIVRNDSITKSRTVKFASSPVLSRQDCHSPKASLNEERKLILDFCSKLYAARNSDNAIGFVVDEENDKHTHHFTLVDPIISNESQMKSLNDLLSCSERESRRNDLSRGGRLRIAVILASSILQLHGTPWLKSHWTCKDVYLLERNISGNGQGHVYPYLPWKLCKDDSSSPVSNIDQKQPARCEILFALGQVLVELCFGKPLTELCAPEDDLHNEETLRTTTAQRLLDEVDREMGDSYVYVNRLT